MTPRGRKFAEDCALTQAKAKEVIKERKTASQDSVSVPSILYAWVTDQTSGQDGWILTNVFCVFLDQDEHAKKRMRPIYYYMASSGQDESNPALWLATGAGKMEVSCPLGTTRRVPQEKFLQKPYNKYFIDQACSVKMAAYWPRSFFC